MLAIFGHTHLKGTDLGTPLIDDAPLSMECEIIDILDGGECDVFVLKVVNTYVEEADLTDKGSIDFQKVRPVLFEMETSIEGLSYSFPTPAELLALKGPIEDNLGPLGIIGTRSRTIAQIARGLEDGELDLGPFADVPAQIERLLAIKGIDSWSAQYLAMRTMSYPDAFLEGDVEVKYALPDYSPKERLALAERWRPWRSYANLCLWNSLR